jgi:hypothetical protein
LVRMPSATSSHRSFAFSALMTTAAPALASSSAVERPMFRALPVTIATLPFSSFIRSTMTAS